MKLKFGLVALAALGGVALSTGAASAVPNGMPQANQVSNVDQVRYVCNPWGRCWWRPNYRPYAYYVGPPRFYGGWRHRYWHRPWHRW
jgi:hypothetical protein